MDIQERRIVGALLLLFGVSLLVIGIYANQPEALTEMLNSVFTTLP